MRHIDRLPKPEILEKKEQEWTEKFLVSDKDRPDSSKYGHREIRGTLGSMSHHKCFYCEKNLKGESAQIDHYIEVSINKTKAFEWENLYLSCEKCNKKLNHNTISVTETLNPCLDSDEEIQNHISFVKDEIIPKNDSLKGKKTIQKYKLDSPDLDLLRLKELSKFYSVLDAIRENQISKNGRAINENEKLILINFAQSNHQFSLMFLVLLQTYNIL